MHKQAGAAAEGFIRRRLISKWKREARHIHVGYVHRRNHARKKSRSSRSPYSSGKAAHDAHGYASGSGGRCRSGRRHAEGDGDTRLAVRRNAVEVDVEGGPRERFRCGWGQR